MVGERLAYRLCRRSDIDEQRGTAWDELDGRNADCLFLGSGDLPPRLVFDVLCPARKCCAAMDACQYLRVAEIVQVLADCLRRHRKAGGELLDQNPAARFCNRDDFSLSVGQEHGTPFDLLSF